MKGRTQAKEKRLENKIHLEEKKEQKQAGREGFHAGLKSLSLAGRSLKSLEDEKSHNYSICDEGLGERESHHFPYPLSENTLKATEFFKDILCKSRAKKI